MVVSCPKCQKRLASDGVGLWQLTGEVINMPTTMRGTVSCGENQAATTTPMNPRPDGIGGDVVGTRLCDQHVKPTGKSGQATNQTYPERDERRRQFVGDDKRLWRAEVHAGNGRCRPRNQEPDGDLSMTDFVSSGERWHLSRIHGTRGRERSEIRRGLMRAKWAVAP